MELSIIIVNWNSADYVRKCLRSLFGGVQGIEFEVIVVDNASFDSCERIIHDEFPKVSFYQNIHNLGFAKANNYGSEKAKGEYFLFLNPDTEIIDNAIGGMLSVIKSASNPGVLGCRLLNTDNTIQTSCIQMFPTILNQFFDSDFANRWFPFLSFGKVNFEAKVPTSIQAVSGACLMISKKVFEVVEKFSSEYFMYSEDVDLCYKVQRIGYKNYYTGLFSVIHHGGGSSHQRKENSFANIQMRESIYKFLKKTKGNLYAEVYRWVMLINGVIRIGMLSIVNTVALAKGEKTSYNASIIKWKGIIRWTLGFEKWVR